MVGGAKQSEELIRSGRFPPPRKLYTDLAAHAHTSSNSRGLEYKIKSLDLYISTVKINVVQSEVQTIQCREEVNCVAEIANPQ